MSNPHKFNYNEVIIKIISLNKKLYLRIYDRFNPSNTLLSMNYSSVILDIDDNNNLIVRNKYEIY